MNEKRYVDEKVLKALILKIAELYASLDARITKLEGSSSAATMDVAAIKKALEDVLYGENVE